MSGLFTDPAWAVILVAVLTIAATSVERHYRPVRRLVCRLRGHRWRYGIAWWSDTSQWYRPSRTCRRCGRVEYTGRASD